MVCMETTTFIEIEFPDGASARWAVEDETTADRVAEAVEQILGQPDTLRA